jgi:hypothetical protein
MLAEVTTIFVFFERWSAAVWDSCGRAIRVGVRHAASYASFMLGGGG